MEKKLINLVPTLFIGLGGTGQKIVGRLKKKIDAQFHGVADLPVYYLCLDTDSPQRTQFNFRPDEFIEISNFDGASVLNKLDRYPAIKAWWPDMLKAGDVGNVDFGAGQTRPVGRMAYYYWYTQAIKDAIERKAKELTVIRSASQLQALEDHGIAVEPNTVAVYVVSSLCGGTGSGLFLDLSFEVRNHLKLRKGVEMIAIFTMPEGYIRIVPRGLQSERVQANAFAALKEIDYFANADNAKGLQLQFTSNSRAFNPEFPLFDMMSLLDIIDAQGNELDHIDQLYDMTATKLALELFVAGDRRSALRNVKIRREIVMGRRRLYDSFGVGALVFHAHNLVQYCRARLAEDVLAEVTRPMDARPAIKNFLLKNELEEHGADQVLNKFRRVFEGKFTALIPSQPDDPARSSIQIQQVMDQVTKQLEEIKKSIETGVRQIRDHAVKQLAAEVRGWMSNSSTSLNFVTHFLKGMKLYVNDILLKEMAKEKKDINVDVIKGRMDEARAAVKQAEDGVWIPVLKSRNIQQRFVRWYHTTRAWTLAACETLSRTAAERIYADVARAIDEHLARLKPLEDMLAYASWEAHQIAENEIKNVTHDIESTFTLIEGVVDPGDERFEKIYKEYRPTVSLKVDELLKATAGFEETLKGVPEPAVFLRDVVLPVFKDEFMKIYDVDLLTAVQKYNPTFDVQRALANIVANCRPFLSVDKEALGEERRPEHTVFVGVPDTAGKPYLDLLTQDKVGTNVNVVATGDKSRIIVLVTEVGYPSHILSFLRDYKHFYDQFAKRAERGEPEFSHLDKRWNNAALPDLIPKEMQ